MRRFAIAPLLLASLLMSAPVLAQEAQVVVAAPVAVAGEPVAHLSVLEAIRQGRTLLKQEVERRRAQGPRSVAALPDSAHVTLAIWEKDADKISLVDIDKSGKKIGVRTPGEWPLKVKYDNRLYSQYALPASRNAVVIGVVYPVANKSGSEYEMHDTLYVPFQDEFYRPEVLAAGSDYLSNLIHAAFDELRTKGIRSRAYPDKLVADVIDPYLIKSIVVIEHSSHVQLLSDNEPERVLGVFLAKLGISGEEAFSAALSSAGAAGIAQFIPSTYKSYVERRPDLGLIPDFKAGMSDHKNAVKAEVVYLDQSLAGMPPAIKNLYALDKTRAAEFLAASYNGGETRVKKAFAVFGEEWAMTSTAQLDTLKVKSASLKSRIAMLKDRLARGKYPVENGAALKEAEADRKAALAKISAINSSALRKETADYVAKLRKTYSLFSAGAFATPAAPSGALPFATSAVTSEPSASGGPDAICLGDGGCVPAF